MQWKDEQSLRQAIQRLLNAAAMQTLPDGLAETLLAAVPRVGSSCIVRYFRPPGLSGLELLRAEGKQRGASACPSKRFNDGNLIRAIATTVRPRLLP